MGLKNLIKKIEKAKVKLACNFVGCSDELPLYIFLQSAYKTGVETAAFFDRARDDGDKTIYQFEDILVNSLTPAYMDSGESLVHLHYVIDMINDLDYRQTRFNTFYEKVNPLVEKLTVVDVVKGFFKKDSDSSD